MKLNKQQVSALEMSVVCLISQASVLEAKIQEWEHNISGPMAHKLERGNFYKRHMESIETTTLMVLKIKESIIQVNQMLWEASQ